MANNLWINNTTKTHFDSDIATNKPNSRAIIQSSKYTNNSGLCDAFLEEMWDLHECRWHTPPGHIRQERCTRQKKKAHHSGTVTILTHGCAPTHILTFSVSIWHPSACCPLRPSPTATDAGSGIRCSGTLLAGMQLGPGGNTERSRGGGRGDTPLEQSWHEFWEYESWFKSDLLLLNLFIYFFLLSHWVQSANSWRAVPAPSLKVATSYREKFYSNSRVI